MNTAAIVSALTDTEGLLFSAVLRKESGQTTLVPRLLWPANAVRPEGVSDLAQTSLDRGTTLIQRGETRIDCAVPVTIDDRIQAQVVLCFDRIQATERAIQTACMLIPALVELAIRRSEPVIRETVASSTEGRGHGSLEFVLRAIGMALEESGGHTSANRAVISLAEGLGCQRVSIGVQQGKVTRLLAVSDSPDVRTESALAQSLVACIDETLDQRLSLRVSSGGGAPDHQITTAHHQHLADHGATFVMSIPFRHREFSGAFVFERPLSKGDFDSTEALLAETLVAYLGRVVLLQELTDPGLLRLTRDWCRAVFASLWGRGRRGFQAASVVAIVLIGLGTFVPVNHDVSGEVIIEGERQRAMVAPFDGYVVEALVKAGDSVRQGQLLARLDDRDFQIERARAIGLIEQHRSEYQEAMSKRDRATASAALSQMDQAQAQLTLAEERIARAVVRAPFDGVVITGDLSQRLGAPLRRGDVMFEIALSSGISAVLMIEDVDIDRIELGMTGSMRLRSSPTETIPFEVNRITSVTVAEGGWNRFRVEATIEAEAKTMRPGMQGMAKITIDRRPLFWIWSHRFIGWLELMVWSKL